MLIGKEIESSTTLLRIQGAVDSWIWIGYSKCVFSLFSNLVLKLAKSGGMAGGASLIDGEVGSLKDLA